MKLYVGVLIVVLAMALPAQALLGAKLALLGVLRNSFGGGGYGNGGNYDGGYGRTYGGGYGSGAYANVPNYNRPVYTGHTSNYGWGQQSYGGGYAGGYGAGGGGGGGGGGYNNYNNEEAVKVVKVIINHERPQAYYDNYGRSSSAALDSSLSTPSSADWAPPNPVVQTYSSLPVHSAQVAAPASVDIPAQSTQFSAPAPCDGPAQAPVQISVPTPAQVIQPPPRTMYVQPPPHRFQPVYQQNTAQAPVQYPVQQTIYQPPQNILLPPPQPLPQVKTVKVIVDGDSQRVPAETYGSPPQAPTSYPAPSVDNAGAWNSNSWSTAASLGNGWNSVNTVGSGPWKTGGIWESIGC